MNYWQHAPLRLAGIYSRHASGLGAKKREYGVTNLHGEYASIIVYYQCFLFPFHFIERLPWFRRSSFFAYMNNFREPYL